MELSSTMLIQVVVRLIDVTTTKKQATCLIVKISLSLIMLPPVKYWMVQPLMLKAIFGGLANKAAELSEFIQKLVKLFKK